MGPKVVPVSRGCMDKTDYSQFAPKPTRSPYQLAQLPTCPDQLVLLILPTRPTSTTNSPHVVCQLAQFSDQLAPTLTNSPHFSYQLAPLLLSTRLTSIINSSHVFANSPHFSDQVGWVYDCSYHPNLSKYIIGLLHNCSHNVQSTLYFNLFYIHYYTYIKLAYISGHCILGIR